MTELERAIRWLEELKEESRTAAKALKNEVSEEIIADFNREVTNCRVLLDALRWIPVNNGLPKTDDDVEVVTDDGLVLFAAYFHGAETWWWQSRPIKVTHWRPLPEAPKEG